MEEFDSHTEHAGEQAHEAAYHESRQRWVTGVALTAAILAAMAAVTSMLSGHHEHEAMMHQITASDKWSEYQAKKIKTLVREGRLETLESSGHTGAAAEKELAKLKKSVKNADADEEKLSEEAKTLEASSRFHDKVHMILGGGVTLFQVAIAVAAISALTRRREYWFVGIALGALALGFLCAGLLVSGGVLGHKPEEPKEEEAPKVAWIAPSSLPAVFCRADEAEVETAG